MRYDDEFKVFAQVTVVEATAEVSVLLTTKFREGDATTTQSFLPAAMPVR